MKKNFLLGCALSSGIIFSACSSTPPEVKVVQANNLAHLQGKVWIVSQIGSQPITYAQNAQTANIEFSPTEARFSGSDSCNRIMGSYQADNLNNISLGQVASTQMACLSNNGQIEQAYQQALQHVAKYTVNHQQLILFDAEGNALVTFISPIQPR
ncbi:MAG: META domain-containing protein [Acinetobacter populi]|jgi:copper homeostasis protein (lipoprotein)|uniref:META domain-containing protein n=1 Tax=Acinetobacter populi TaxID=1582270 RepID=UPI002355F487|nr:META domain-containing protein [Acinetobacter populi]MCH4246941.1 META domain-containing protein [Acinetobacter populi]